MSEASTDARISTDTPDPLDLVHVVVRELSSRVDHATPVAQVGLGQPPAPRSPIVAQLIALAGQVAQIRRVRGVVEGEYRIGVFGASKRGKSSILNALLGVPLLPVHKVPTTAVEIEVCHDPVSPADRFQVMDSTSPIPHTVRGVKSATDRLEQVAVRQSAAQDVRTRVTVEGAFSGSALFQTRCARSLVDTPGADGLLESQDEALVAEGQRALSAMLELDAVLFCVRLDLLQHQDDFALFKRHCAALRPITVATYLDAWDHPSNPAEQVADMFEVPVGRVVCIDAQAANEGNLRAMQSLEDLVSLIQEEVKRGQSPADDVELALRQLEFVLHAEAMRHICSIQWPDTAWNALKAVVSGRAFEILTRIEQRRDRARGRS